MYESLCAHIHVGTWGGRKRVLNILELEVQMVDPDLGHSEWNLGLLKEASNPNYRVTVRSRSLALSLPLSVNIFNYMSLFKK